MFLLFRHLFLPHSGNNHRARILHHKSLFVLILFLLVGSFLTFSLRRVSPSVLGIATNINVADLLSHTNEERQEKGLVPLTLSETLSMAATAKAKNMFEMDYWAHNAPDGTTPWAFFKNAGYDYIYAGENLAKDFNTSEGVVEGWMASPSHRDNMLSVKYDEIGFAIVNGTLNGGETTLVVEMLGSTLESQASKRDGISPVAQALLPTPTLLPPSLQQDAATRPPDLVAGITNKPLIDSTLFTKRVALAIIFVLLLAFVLDMAYVERKKLIRLVGHNLDHIFFLFGAIILIFLFGKGVIL